MADRINWAISEICFFTNENWWHWHRSLQPSSGANSVLWRGYLRMFQYLAHWTCVIGFGIRKKKCDDMMRIIRIRQIGEMEKKSSCSNLRRKFDSPRGKILHKCLILTTFVFLSREFVIRTHSDNDSIKVWKMWLQLAGPWTHKLINKLLIGLFRSSTVSCRAA